MHTTGCFKINRLILSSVGHITIQVSSVLGYYNRMNPKDPSNETRHVDANKLFTIVIRFHGRRLERFAFS